jgi:hypothetical protein
MLVECIDFKSRLLKYFPSLEVARLEIIPRLEKYKKIRTIQNYFYVGCWEWIGARMSKGYGVINIGPKYDSWTAPVHKLSYFLQYLEIPPSGLDILHKCDFPPCFNPDHLFIGSLNHNAFDASKKGRIKNQYSYQKECW